MLKKVFVLFLLMIFSYTVAQAEVKKIAVVDIQKVVTNSLQVQALKKEQETKKKELIAFIKKAEAEVKTQTDSSKQKALAEKYDKQIKLKQESIVKSYQKRLEAIDKNINAVIIQHAKTMGYDIVLAKGVVLYGGDDITDAVIKVVK